MISIYETGFANYHAYNNMSVSSTTEQYSVWFKSPRRDTNPQPSGWQERTLRREKCSRLEVQAAARRFQADVSLISSQRRTSFSRKVIRKLYQTAFCFSHASSDDGRLIGLNAPNNRRHPWGSSRGTELAFIRISEAQSPLPMHSIQSALPVPQNFLSGARRFNYTL
jgi:hypothetical protein